MKDLRIESNLLLHVAQDRTLGFSRSQRSWKCRFYRPEFSVGFPLDFAHVVELDIKGRTDPCVNLLPEQLFVGLAISLSSNHSQPYLSKSLLDDLALTDVRSMLKNIIEPHDSRSLGSQHVIVDSPKYACQHRRLQAAIARCPCWPHSNVSNIVAN